MSSERLAPIGKAVNAEIASELWLNLKTASQLGIAFPPSILAGADREIE
jgi:hypothetical protein